MKPLLLTTRAELKVNEEYYSSKEFCIIGGDEMVLEMRVCHPVCSSEVPCVRKCCDIDQVWNFQNGNPEVPARCILSTTKSWTPNFYLSANRKVPTDQSDQIHPHYFISHPRSFHNANKTIHVHEQRHLVTEKLSWIFRIGLNQNYYRRKSRYSWINYAESWDSSCVDGVVHSRYRNSSGLKGMEEEDVLIESIPKESEPISVTSPKLQIGIYSSAMIFSALFILLTLVVHVLLWRRQGLHDWTLMSYCASLFCTNIFFAFKYIHSITTLRGVKADGLCLFIGVMVNFFFISTFCWLTAINFDLWVTFRKLQVPPTSSRRVKRYLAYTAISITIPFIFISVGLILDALYVNEPETSWVIPEYGLIQCGPHQELAQWIYQTIPAGILFLFNLVFFVLTAFSIYKLQEGAKFASSRNRDVKSRTKLFCKLLVLMGVLYIFEFISTLAEDISRGNVSWYWQIFDVLNFFQGFFIFVIIVCKRQTWNALTEKYGILKRFERMRSVGTTSTPSAEHSSQIQMRSQGN